MCTLQFFQQFLRVFLLTSQFSNEGVVPDIGLHLAVLQGEVLILLLHFLFVQLSQLLHVLIGLLLLFETKTQPTYYCQQSNDYNAHKSSIYYLFFHNFTILAAKLVFFYEKHKENLLVFNLFTIFAS